jgi:hypothetical protein
MSCLFGTMFAVRESAQLFRASSLQHAVFTRPQSRQILVDSGSQNRVVRGHRVHGSAGVNGDSVYFDESSYGRASSWRAHRTPGWRSTWRNVLSVAALAV